MLLPYLTLSYPLYTVTWVTWVTATYPLSAVVFIGLGNLVTFLAKNLKKINLKFKINIMKTKTLFLFLLLSVSCTKQNTHSEDKIKIKEYFIEVDFEDYVMNYGTGWISCEYNEKDFFKSSRLFEISHSAEDNLFYLKSQMIIINIEVLNVPVKDIFYGIEDKRYSSIEFEKHPLKYDEDIYLKITTKIRNQ